MESDPWLTRWIPLIRVQAESPRILELGCGQGRDTQSLLRAGFDRITVLDHSEQAVARCQTLSDSLQGIVHDLRMPLPFADLSFEVVLASLCLHYFSWATTEACVREIKRVLIPGGLMLCRVNSTQDTQYGAVGYPEIDRHYYQVNAGPKRFFDQSDLEALFDSSWERLGFEEIQIDRYEKPKVVWEVLLLKA